MKENREDTETLLSEQASNWPEVDTPAHRLVIRLLRLQGLMRQVANVQIRKFGLSGVEVDALATLRKMSTDEPVRPSVLSRHLLITSGGMTRALKSLSEKGLIELMPDAEDKRGKNIRLTEKGKALSEDVIHAILESQGKLWKQSGANEKQIRKLDDALKSMLSNIEASDG
ncbi:MarR family winged helix-turn-helix transcriptional regulator [Parvibaculum sp.]|uniref:MarR family winged helix-turn-helix transcriptional regulator n=1 Tax=Parvibaculum sp. TaxID=2024848 RepID=UPI000C97EA15|nr:MarR family winged helix-turn-helix transcriptional regulator [Parvibaculum sp.]MAB13535.1 hypothetical protein [Parvibaculum sp.]